MPPGSPWWWRPSCPCGSERVTEARAVERVCGGCSLCCTVLRVDELGKLGGEPCVHQRTGEEGGCSIHPTRPGICRAYRCLWLRGGLDEPDRPDRLGAVLDVASEGGSPYLAVREAEPGAFDRSPRLREIAERYRASMPVRVTTARDVMNPDRPYRVLLPDGEEQRFDGDWVTVLQEGCPPQRRRVPWLERGVRRLALRLQAWRLRRLRRRRAPPDALRSRR